MMTMDYSKIHRLDIFGPVVICRGLMEAADVRGNYRNIPMEVLFKWIRGLTKLGK